ncbi:MAG TPA: 23S rRNA (adenine(2503)-C(2))-methyltransferase RlmN [Firmicutes bacterium]|nr:23S rRNA (adenine(2503)-C(2))-methyltransferase RlmN [Bacillota bacterium]
MNIKGLFLEELQEFFHTMGLPKYRAAQIYTWIYQKQACTWEEMTDLPKDLRGRLTEQGLALGSLTPVNRIEDSDGTIKFLFELEDHNTIESVFIPEDERLTSCISTQVGCGMQCSFCATGQNGLIRNLTAAEIIDQLLTISRQTKSRINNVVIMGQGEPLANYEATLNAIKLMNDPKGMGIGARHITISTCGVIPGILKLAKEPLQVNLAISLHAADDGLRTRLMPINKVYPLSELMTAIRNYIELTGRRVTFEYTMIDGINDRPQDLGQLIQLLSGLLCHVNLIPLNPVKGSAFGRSKMERIHDFISALTRVHIEATIRKERGTNLAAACGQLQGGNWSKNDLAK